MSPKVTRITFLLCPGYASVSLVCAVEPLRAANQLSGQKLYTWDVVSAEGVRWWPAMVLQQCPSVAPAPYGKPMESSSALDTIRKMLCETM